MMIADTTLTEENFLLYCAKAYDGRFYSSTEEFLDDLKRIGYIKKLVTRYVSTGELKERLILNHIITLHNVFGAENVCRILFFKLKDQLEYIKPFLVLMNILPEVVYGVGDSGPISTDEIPMDQGIIDALRKLQ